MAEARPVNAGAEWTGDGFNTPDYVEHHYSKLGKADNYIANRVIAALLRLHGGSVVIDYDSLTDIGTGGTLRTACLAAPFLRPNTKVRFTDIGGSQLVTTRKEIAAVQAGKSTKWHRHVKGMVDGHPDVDNGRRHPEWTNALGIITASPVVERLSIFDGDVPPARIRTEGHVLCSITKKKKVHDAAAAHFYGSMEPDDVAVRLFDIGSKGYWVGDQFFQGYPIDPEQVSSQAERMGLVVVDVFATEANNPPTEGGNAASTFTGLGGAVLLRPGPLPSYIDLGTKRVPEVAPAQRQA